MKKAEIQIQETIIVIFIITIIIGLGIFLFYRYTLSSLEKTKLEYEEDQVYSLLATLPNSAELTYTKLNNPQNAIDTSKLFNVKLANLGFKEINIKQVYPKEDNVTCNKNNYPKCNSYLIYSNKGNKESSQILTTPISLYFPRTNEYKAGLLEIKWYF